MPVPVGVLNFVGTRSAKFSVFRNAFATPFPNVRVTAFSGANTAIAYGQGTTDPAGDVTLKVEAGPVELIVEPLTNGYSEVDILGVATDKFKDAVGGAQEDRLVLRSNDLFLSPQTVVLKLAPATKVGFQLRDSVNSAIAGATVQLKSLDGLLFQTLTTDAGGLVQFDIPTANWNGEDALMIDAGDNGVVVMEPPEDGSFVTLQNDGV